MNGRFIAGITFQIIQFIILGLFGLVFFLNGVTISENLYYLIFGGIIFLGFNILSLVLILTGLDDKKETRKKEYPDY